LTYITTNQWGIELAQGVAEDIRNEYRFGEGEERIILFTKLKKIKKW
jgi:hypothetical protein